MALSASSCNFQSKPKPTIAMESKQGNSGIDLPVGDDHVNLPKDPTVEKSNLPESVRYLDNTRDLRDSYTLEEAFKRYAIKLHHSTLIVTKNSGFSMNHSFYCCNYTSNEYFREDVINFFGDLYDCDTILEDTEYTSLGAFKSDFVDVLPVTVRDTTLITTKEANIIEETDDYIIGMIPYFSESYTTSGNNFYYYFAKMIGNRVYVVRCTKGQKKLDDTDVAYLKEKCLLLFANLYEDDGREAYIYDKVLNISVFGDKHIRSFDCIDEINNEYVDLRGWDYDKLFINPSEGTIDFLTQYGVSNWEQLGDMQMQSAPSYASTYMFTRGKDTFILIAFIEPNSSDELIDLLVKAGLII